LEGTYIGNDRWLSRAPNQTDRFLMHRKNSPNLLQTREQHPTTTVE